MTIILDGKNISALAEEDIKKRVAELKELKGFVPILATILVGSDPASATYVKMKGNACERVGMKSLKVEMSGDINTQELLIKIKDLNENPEVHGILLQHPVPDQIDESNIVYMSLKAGEISLHTDALLHGSDSNSSDKPRSGLAMRFSPTDVKCDLSVWPSFETQLARGQDIYRLNPISLKPRGEATPKSMQFSKEFEKQW